MKYFLSLIVLFCLQTKINAGESITFTVEIDNIESNEGQIIVSAYTSEDQYTDHPKFYFTFSKKEMKGDRLTCTIKDLPAGKYVFSLLDDTNSNNEMDYNWLQLPKEGYGFSKNLKPSIKGAPNYKDCLIPVKNGDVIKLSMQYW